jgi:ubiquinol-cytochrome c reductase cytochrome b subunit/menaquinol-cytochrome c reductase cytochrome b subunit
VDDSAAAEGLIAVPRLPMPPLPKLLQPKPKRPGNGGNGKNGKPPLDPAEAGITVVDWVDERTSLSPTVRWLLFRHVPRGTNWAYTLGSATLFAFLSQAVTGVFLALWYRPDATGGAYESIRYINDNVFLGQFVHAMHKWGASLMIILIFLHMGRVFFYGAYKYPRELTWIIGVVLLILTLTMGFTGYLLPFDQRSYWASIVGVNINGTGPVIGPFLSDFLRGGNEFGATTLSRFYGIHMLLLPGLIIALIGVHIYLVSKLGTTAPPWLKPERDDPLIQDLERADV